MTRKSQFMAALLASVLVISMAAPAIAGMTSVNWDGEAAQDPKLSADVTKDYHTVGSMAAVEYEDDSGEMTMLPAVVNSSEDVDDLGTGYVNVYSFKASDINASDFDAFPHSKDDVSGLDAAEWSISGDGTTNAGTSDVTTAPGVDAVNLATNGSMVSSGTTTFTMNNFSITSDADKRYIQVVMDVNTLDSGTVGEVQYHDTDGDYVNATIDSGATPGNHDVITNQTGEGIVYQEQVGNLTVYGTGDGSMGEIQKIEVVADAGDLDVDIAGLNAEKTSEWNFGTERMDTDDDDDFETASVTERGTPGDISIHDLSTMGSTFDGATIRDVTIPMEFRARDLAEEEQTTNISFMSADSYPSFEWLQESYYRFELPDAYDLSYANTKLIQTWSVPDSRYETLEVNEGADGTDFGQIDSWTDQSGSISSEGETDTIDGSIQVGQEIVVHEEVLTTDSEKQELESVGGAAGQFEEEDSGGGLVDQIFSLPGLVIGGLAGWLGLRSRGS